MVLFAALVLTLVLAPISARLELEQSLESFFASDDPLLRDWLHSLEWFGRDEFVMVAYSDHQMVQENPDDPGAVRVDSVRLNRLRDFARKLSEVPGVVPESTLSLESLMRPKFGDSFAARVVARSYARKRQDEILAFGENIVISHDHQTTAVILRLQSAEDAPIRRAEVFRRIRDVALTYAPQPNDFDPESAAGDSAATDENDVQPGMPVPPSSPQPSRIDEDVNPNVAASAFVAGEPIQVNDMFRYVDQDSRVLGWASSGLLVATLLLLFRSLRWVVLPLLVVHVTLVWTKAILVLSGMRLSMVSSTLTSLVTIIGIATTTHVAVNYRELRLSHDRATAFRLTLLRLGPPVFWTCVTTAVGFGALLSSQIVPVQSFGMMLALAALLVMIVCAVILPGGVLDFRVDRDPRPTVAELRLVRFLQHLGRGVDRHPRTWLAGLVLLMGLTGIGLGMLRVETDFSKNFRESSQIVRALRFFEHRMGGVGTWEVNFPLPGPLEEESLKPVRELVDELRAIALPDGTGLTKVVALTDGVDFAPGSGVEQKLERMAVIQPEFISGLYNPDEQRMRISLRALEQKPAEVKLELIRQVTRTAQTHFPQARPTGFYLLLANLISSLLKDQLVSFLLASAGIFLCMTIAFRSPWIGLLSLLPNMFPLVLVIGGMGWLDVPINIGTAMIASVSMGLTVDSSIHYIAGYLRARDEGATYAEALKMTHGTVGVAMVFANVVLAMGFLVLALSNFIPLVYFGVLVSLSMLGGLLGDLAFLPLLLRWVPVKSKAIVEGLPTSQDVGAPSGVTGDRPTE